MADNNTNKQLLNVQITIKLSTTCQLTGKLGVLFYTHSQCISIYPNFIWHGCDNSAVLLSSSLNSFYLQFEVIAVLDWELATLGHPVSDLSYTCLPYHWPKQIPFQEISLGELWLFLIDLSQVITKQAKSLSFTWWPGLGAIVLWMSFRWVLFLCLPVMLEKTQLKILECSKFMH